MTGWRLREEGTGSFKECVNKDLNKKESNLTCPRLVNGAELNAEGLFYLQGKDCLLFICI